MRIEPWMHLVLRKSLPLLFSGLLLSTPSAWAQTSTNAAPDASQTAEAYVKFGRTNGANQDLKSAIAAFDEAIRIDPKYAPAYENRGVARMLQHNLDDALVDFNKAIELDPKYQEAYYNRGTTKAQKGDFDGSISDFDHAIELNPKFASAFYNRGHAKYFKGDLDGALADTNQAIELDPSSPYSFFIRGLIRHAKEDSQGASSDFQQSATYGFPFGAFWLWSLKMESGDRGLAGSDLAEYAKKPQLFKEGDWPTFIIGFLLGKVTEEKLLSRAKEGDESKNRVCEAYFYLGMYKSYAGDAKGAQDAYQKAVDSGAKDSEEYIEAQRRLKSAP